MINEKDIDELLVYLEDTSTDDKDKIILDVTTDERDTLIDALVLYKEMNTIAS